MNSNHPQIPYQRIVVYSNAHVLELLVPVVQSVGVRWTQSSVGAIISRLPLVAFNVACRVVMLIRGHHLTPYALAVATGFQIRYILFGRHWVILLLVSCRHFEWLKNKIQFLVRFHMKFHIIFTLYSEADASDFYSIWYVFNMLDSISSISCFEAFLDRFSILRSMNLPDHKSHCSTSEALFLILVEVLVPHDGHHTLKIIQT